MKRRFPSRLGRVWTEKKATPGTLLNKAIMQGLQTLGFRVKRMNTGAMTVRSRGKMKVGGQTVEGPEKKRFIRFGFLGSTDIIFFIPDDQPNRGRTGYIETKQPGEKMSPDQLEFQAFCKAANIPHIVAESWDDVFAWLKENNLEKGVKRK